jgi:hypothetical protein
MLSSSLVSFPEMAKNKHTGINYYIGIASE